MNFLKKYTPCILVAGVFLALVMVSDVAAQTLQENINAQIGAGAQSAGYGESSDDPRLIAMTIIRVSLSFLGTIFLALIVYAGFLRLTSHGEEARIDKSKRIFTSSTIGLFIVLAAYMVTNFVLPRVLNVTRGEEVYEIKDDGPGKKFTVPVINF